MPQTKSHHTVLKQVESIIKLIEHVLFCDDNTPISLPFVDHDIKIELK
jgi:hypothetical protein